MIYSKNDKYELRLGKMQDELKDIPDNSIDSIITDPPYELGFMGKSWDKSGIAFQKETWEECLRVLKPGGHMLAFGGSRTFHRIACAIEDAGFEIRDTILWLHGQGFPKSMNIGLAIDKKNKESQNYWKGWGTQLKPAFEPVVMARKPVEGSITDNVIKYRVGAINIDECRVPTGDTLVHGGSLREITGDDITGKSLGMFKNGTENTFEQNPFGRFPANVITDGSADVAEGFPYRDHPNGSIKGETYDCLLGNNCYGKYSDKIPEWNAYQDSGSAMRYFYCAKASKKDRDSGLDELELKDAPIKGYRPWLDKKIEAGMSDYNDFMRITPKKNNHPTVKPCELMQYLIRLVSPKGAIILDPFMGSGSTGKAAMIENVERGSDYKFIGIEMTDEYLPIAEARIKFGCNYSEKETKKPAEEKVICEEEKSNKKINLFK